MARLVPRDGFVKETNIKSQSGVRRYKADKAGMYTVSNPRDIQALKDQGFTEENLARHSAGDSARGYTCTQCGFGSWFGKCSRCGETNESTPRTDGDIEYGDDGSN